MSSYFGNMNRQAILWNERENLKIDIRICRNLVYDIVGTSNHWGKGKILMK